MYVSEYTPDIHLFLNTTCTLVFNTISNPVPHVGSLRKMCSISLIYFRMIMVQQRQGATRFRSNWTDKLLINLKHHWWECPVNHRLELPLTLMPINGFIIVFELCKRSWQLINIEGLFQNTAFDTTPYDIFIFFISIYYSMLAIPILHHAFRIHLTYWVPKCRHM